jgi:hypothetical protein
MKKCNYNFVWVILDNHMCKLVKLFDYLIDLYIFENFFKVLFSLFEQ